MRLGPSTGLSDAGRKRRRNEDSFVVDPPLFVIADGMGGAQAGEVASRLAASAFREYHEADELAPEERLAAIVHEANRRIYDRSRSDAATTGMGTTITAALFTGGGVTIGHVGDSRAYRLRDDRLEQLTHDHSLVGDLVRSGRLSPEEARLHPQRSVITRALGTDPDVDVDTFTLEPQPGDVYLLCSDGLTDMLEDDEIVALVRDTGGLDSTAKALVKAANRKGGEDNVTVVLFAVEEGDAPAELEETVALTANGQGEPDDLEDTLTGLEGLKVPAADAGPPPAELEQTATWEPVPERPAAASTAGEPRGERSRGRRVFLFVVALALVALLLLVAFWGLGEVVAYEAASRLVEDEAEVLP
jgi:PPM family protein phosphatase